MTLTDFRDAIKQTHKRSVEAWVCDATGQRERALAVVDGSVTEDLSNASGTRSGTLVVPLVDEYVPRDETHVLHPFANKRIEVSVSVRGATQKVGMFVIGQTEVQRPLNRIAVTLVDYAYLTKQSVYETVYVPPPAQTVILTIQALVRDATGVMPAVAADESGGATIGSRLQETVAAGTSRWDIANELAAGIDCDLFFDEDLRLRLQKTDRVRVPKDVIGVGRDGVVTAMTSAVSRMGVVNKAIVTVEDNAGNTFVGTKTIASGPLRYGGPMGSVATLKTMRVAVGSQLMADNTAQRLLTRVSGLSRTLSLTTSPIPHVRAGDTVTVVFRDGSRENALVQRVTHGLSTEAPSVLETRYEPATWGTPLTSALRLGGG